MNWVPVAEAIDPAPGIGFRFRVRCLGCRVEGLGFRV